MREDVFLSSERIRRKEVAEKVRYNENLGQRYALAFHFSSIPHTFLVFQSPSCGFLLQEEHLIAVTKFLICEVCYKDTTNKILITESPANHYNSSTTCRVEGALKVFQRER